MSIIRLLLFPYAGGTSNRIYASWKTHLVEHYSSDKVQVNVEAVDYPGRLVRPDDPKLDNVEDLADYIFKEKFTNETKLDERIVLFGHSFGALVAFEIAKRLEEHQESSPLLALIVSASRPPSASVQEQVTYDEPSSGSFRVSEMDLSGMADYFESRGSFRIPNELINEPAFGKMLQASVRLDYKALEQYPANDSTVRCPLFLIGGDQDGMVSVESLKDWKRHSSTKLSSVKILEGQGHFYIHDSVQTTAIIAYVMHSIESAVAAQEACYVDTVKKIFATVLSLDASVVIAMGPDSHFFDLGGTSLDTMALITQIKSAFDIHVTQNEFFMHPTVESLSHRIKQLKEEASGAVPLLTPVAGSSHDSTTWFPASSQQEQMVSCWEIAPTMYNMPTTVEFTGEPVDVPLLKRAFVFAVEQQPTLRTVIRIDPNTNAIQQRVLARDQANQCFDLHVCDTTDEESATKIIEAESVYRFDLTRPPVVRGVLVRVAGGSQFLLLNQHHLGSDGWALTILRRQVLRAYIAFAKKQDVPKCEVVPDHPNYVDWTMWTKRWLRDFGQEERQLAYWKEQLRGLPALDLPTDYPRPAVLTAKGMRLSMTVSPETTAAFERLVTSYGANLYAGMLSLYMLMLHRIGGGNDFAVGIALANRHHEGLDKLIGYFANEVAIRAAFREDLTFVDLLRLVRENILQGMANADTPFDKVAEALQVVRDNSRTSVFQAMFALQDSEWHTVDGICPREGNLRFQLKQFDHNTAKFEIHLQLRHDGKGGLHGDLHIATDLFTRESGDRMLKILQNLMQCALETPQDPVINFDVTPYEDKRLIASCNDTKKSYGSAAILDMISTQPRDSVALIFDEGKSTQTFGQYWDRGLKVATYLSEVVGVAKQERIGILMSSSPTSMAAILGVLMAGCTIVVVDPEKTPCDRCRLIFDDASVSSVLVEDEFHTTFIDLNATASIRLINWDSVESFHFSESCRVAQLGGEDVFGIFYTSGTTGMPKGAIVTVANVTNLVNWWREFFDLRASDRVLLFSSLSFIMSVRQYLPTLCTGAAVVIPKASIEFESAILSGKVNKLVCTPSALAALDIARVCSNNQIESIQVAGEAPQMRTMLAWKQQVKRIFIGLGPTELCAHALCGEFDGKTMCIGHPAANVRAYIVDPRTNLQVPINVTGELWIAGENVARGYLNSREITDERFSEDPFTVVGDRIYRTGDLARRLPDGRIQFIGRNDKQLKVNGFRIESADIISSLPHEVTNAHVAVDSGKLVLYVAPVVSKRTIVADLKEKLPTYMIPSQIVCVDTFPLNKNRKVDFAALTSMPDQSMDDYLEDSDDTDEINDSERKLREIIRLVWAETLQIDPASIAKDSNFFEKGGTSLSAVIVCRKLSSELQTDVSVQEVFAHQTIKTLAEALVKLCDAVQSDADPRPLRFLPGGRHSLHPIVFGMLQALGLIVMSIIAVIPLVATIFVSIHSFVWFGKGYGLLIFPAFVLAGCLFHLLLVAGCKWIIIGRYQSGKARVFSFLFLKWWLVRRLLYVTRMYTWIVDETEFARNWFALLGASIGNNVSLEQAFLLEPDLVRIGNDCVVEFEVQFSTAEIRDGILEFRSISIGSGAKLGVRSVILGGAVVHDGCEVAPKSTVACGTSTKSKNQMIAGSPAQYVGETDGNLWRPKMGCLYSVLQLLLCGVMLELISCIAFAGVAGGLVIRDRFGVTAFVLFLASSFLIIFSLALLLMVAILRWILIPVIVPGKLYDGSWFALRKWFLDRLFLSPLFVFASQRILQTSSTFPWYLRLLGSRIGKKVWLTFPYIRVGTELIDFGDEVHVGMHNYISTDRYSEKGCTFHPVRIGKHSSMGQRSVCLSGVVVEAFSTVGAETILSHDFYLSERGTAFGSPPVVFSSTTSFREIVRETQAEANRMLNTDKVESGTSLLSNQNTGGEADDEGGDERLYYDAQFWLYVISMIVVQALLPLVIFAVYGSIFYAIYLLQETSLAHLAYQIPVAYILGSLALMGLMKLMQMVGGSYSVGTVPFFSLRFFYWYIFADFVYLCTSFFIYPFSGTEIYCIWFRIMGAKVGKRVFISPENGGFREIDFLDVGDDVVLMSPNVNAHYADHGMLQFCPVKLESGVEVNPGATIMPLTQYAKRSRLGPFAVTMKGQHCCEATEYSGNPCRSVNSSASERAAMLFPGLGSQYPGMFDQLMTCRSAQQLASRASTILGIDILALGTSSVDPASLQDIPTAQVLVFTASLMAAEVMRQKYPLITSKVMACAGFSMGELSALCFSGALKFDDAVRLVKLQADALGENAGDGAMCNVRGMERCAVEKLCKKFDCEVVNIICDHTGQMSKLNAYGCAGSVRSIDALVNFVESKRDCESNDSLVRAAKIRINGALHTRKMEKAKAKFHEALSKTEVILPERMLVYSCVSGQPYTSATEIRRLLVEQMTRPVQWHRIGQDLLHTEKIHKFLECGPMTSLARMLKRIDPDLADDRIISSDATQT